MPPENNDNARDTFRVGKCLFLTEGMEVKLRSFRTLKAQFRYGKINNIFKDNGNTFSDKNIPKEHTWQEYYW